MLTFQTGNNPTIDHLIHGDCLEVMPKMASASIDFILTDPPYLANYVSRDGRAVPNDDNDRWLKPAFAQMFRLLKGGTFCVTFYGWPNADKFLSAYRQAGFRVVGHLVFPKSYASRTGYVRSQHECAHLLLKGTPWAREETIADVIQWIYSGNKLHPTQKPLSVLAKLIEAFCDRGDLVLDPFAGSGSTLAAARMVGRRYVGIELDAGYHAAAFRRLNSTGAEGVLQSAGRGANETSNLPHLKGRGALPQGEACDRTLQ